MDRREYLGLTTTALVTAAAGCDGGGNGGGDGGGSTGRPNLSASFDIPDSVQVNEDHAINVVITNNGNAKGSASVPIYYQHRQSDWIQFGEIDVEVGAGKSTTWTREAVSWKRSGEPQFRLGENGLSASMEVTLPQEYKPTYARSNATTPTLSMLFRHLERYQSTPVMFRRARVSDTQYSDTFADEYRFKVTNDTSTSADGDDVEYAGEIAGYNMDETRFLPDDILKLWVVPVRYGDIEDTDAEDSVYVAVVDYSILAGK